ncbi:heavy metal-binding domain-containing protein [Dyadobacter sp. CY323]|uniref:heavy metal-binding domain-containing protein n=1 Tax=Dyadobacter sp. CY323 TaxID=2907302 RepID=UPI001F160819|nr:heavy metal-binding domain-containing protein [Dyadobacter sp. CY323]MCE6993005.1 hypothetical protein [Dyadobacter sp. CY323]
MRKILLVSIMLFTMACTGNSEKSGQTTDSTSTATPVADAKKYACPMQCEGDKTYAEAGKCPVCKMELKEIAFAETDSTTHEH